MSLSSRAQLALDVLQAGGRFVHRLERNGYTRRDQFHYRLMNASRQIVRGVGFHTFNELRDRLTLADGGTSVSSYYRLV